MTQLPEALPPQGSKTAADQKDLTFASLQQAVIGHLAKGSASALSPATEDPQQPLLATLDQRLANAPQNSARTARLQTALRAILDPDLLDGAAATITCGSSMCRIDISDADDAHAQKATNAVTRRLPKTFAAAAIYPKGTGERAIYVATDGAELRLGEMHGGPSAAAAK